MSTRALSLPARRRQEPRVWLVAAIADTPEPADHPVVRDDQMRQWRPDVNGGYHTADGRHHASWTELHARFDLVEVSTR